LVPVMAAGLVAVVALWWMRAGQQAATQVTPAVRTVRAGRGVLAPTRRVAGSIAAGRFANIAAPVLQAPDSGRGLTLTYLAGSGTPVQEGDVVAEIDTTDVADHISDVEADVTQSALDIKRRKAVYVAQMESLRQKLRVFKANLEKARQDARTEEIQTPLNREILELAVAQAQAEYDELATEIPFTDERQLADLKLYEMSYDYQVRHLARHMNDMRRCRIRAPMRGMVVMQTIYRGGEMNQIKVGDQLSPGQPFLRVVDPDSMLVDADMSEAESELVRLGQHATIHLDAFPNVVLQGRVASVGAMAYNGRRINYWVRKVKVRLSLDKPDPRVVPDLTASADVVVAEPEPGVIVPREAVVEADGKTVVYVRREGGFSAQEVEIAAATNTQVAVRSGVQEGDEVALYPPAGTIIP
jgi:hypothetical protein